MLNIVRKRNIYHWFKNRSISAEKLNKYLTVYPDTRRDIGALPYDWLKNTAPEKKAELTRQVSNIFAIFVQKTAHMQGFGRQKGWSFVNAELFKEAYGFLEKELKKLLKRNDIKISYAGSGAVKNCHRLDVGEYSYALSGFRSPLAAKEGFGDYFTRYHGRGYEPQNAITAYKLGSHGRFAKTFTTRISDINDEGGYIFSKFIEKQGKTPLGLIQESRGTFINLDKSQWDTINNINTDIGGCIANPRRIQSKKLKNHWRYFALMADNHSQRLKIPHASEIQKYLLDKKLDGTDILSDNFIKKLPFSKEQKRCAMNMLRSLKKIRKQKEYLVQEGVFDKVKKLLEEDFSYVYKFNKNDNLAETIDKYRTFPLLMAEELGISNISVLENWITLYQEYGGNININFANYLTKKEILKFLEKNYDIYRNDESIIRKFEKDFKIQKEIEDFEQKYLKSEAGQSETSWDSVWEFFQREKTN